MISKIRPFAALASLLVFAHFPLKISEAKPKESSNFSAVLSSASSSPTNAAQISVKLTFGAAVSKLSSSAINITQGSVQNISGEGSVYTFNVVPKKSSTAETIAIVIPADKVSSGNASNGVSNTLQISYVPPQSISLGNGITLSNQCQASPLSQAVAFSSTPDHAFMGYGANITAPSAQHPPEQIVADLQTLNLNMVKVDYGNPYVGTKNGSFVAPTGVSDAVMYQTISPVIASYFNQNQSSVVLNASLRSAGIKVLQTMYGTPTSYVDPKTGKATNISDFSQFYVAYFHSMNDLGLTPDFQELQNEPNCGGSGGAAAFSASQFAALVQGIEAGLSRNAVLAHITASGTCSSVQTAVNFLQAIEAVNGLGGLSAVTLHNYYIADYPNNNGVPPADDPAFKTLAQMASSLSIPLISSEFGGTVQKYKDIDPSINDVDPSEEFKAALDLVRSGDSEAMVWQLYPSGSQLTWSLMDDSENPTQAYWPFAALAHIPASNSAGTTSVLRADGANTHISVPATKNPSFPQGNPMLSLGYTAFQYQQKGKTSTSVALANPLGSDGYDSGAAPVSFSLSLPNKSADKLTSFSTTALLSSQSASISPVAGCPYVVTLPSATAVVIDLSN